MNVLFVDDDKSLCEVMVLLCRALEGVECTYALSMKELENNKIELLHTKLVILDINLGNGVANGIDVYNWLKSRQYKGKTVFLTGHGKEHPLVAEAKKFSEVELLEKPVDIKQIEDIILGAR